MAAVYFGWWFGS